jgi:hypothetical protein
MRWAHEFGAYLSVTGNRFKLTLPLCHRISVSTIRYTPLGDWIDLEGTMDAPPAPVVQVVDERKEKKPPVDLEKPPRLA